MTEEKTTVDVLRDAKALLETKGWTQGTNARDAEGRWTGAHHANAACFCGYGAIFAATGGRFDWGQLAALDAVTDGCFPTFNDAEGRTLPEVLAKFDEAIAAEEAKLVAEVQA